MFCTQSSSISHLLQVIGPFHSCKIRPDMAIGARRRRLAAVVKSFDEPACFPSAFRIDTSSISGHLQVIKDLFAVPKIQSKRFGYNETWKTGNDVITRFGDPFPRAVSCSLFSIPSNSKLFNFFALAWKVHFGQIFGRSLSKWRWWTVKAHFASDRVVWDKRVSATRGSAGKRLRNETVLKIKVT